MTGPKHPSRLNCQGAELQQDFASELCDGLAASGNFAEAMRQAVPIFSTSFQQVAHGRERAQFIIALLDRMRRQLIRPSQETVEQPSQRRCWSQERDSSRYGLQDANGKATERLTRQVTPICCEAWSFS